MKMKKGKMNEKACNKKHEKHEIKEKKIIGKLEKMHRGMKKKK